MGLKQSCPFCGDNEFPLHADLYKHINACAQENDYTQEEVEPIVQALKDQHKPERTPTPVQAALEQEGVSERKRGPRPCLCGCDQQVTSRRGKFLPGHDAKLKGKIMKDLKGEAPATGVTPEAWAYAKSMWCHLIPELKEVQL